MSDLRERVARALVESDTFGDKEEAEALLRNPDYMQTMSRHASRVKALINMCQTTSKYADCSSYVAMNSGQLRAKSGRGVDA